MARASKRAKGTATTPTNNGDDSSVVPGVPATPPTFNIPFQTGPNLERIPDDVLQEILSWLPTFIEYFALFGHQNHPPVIPSDLLLRSPVLRALSQTSRVLRSRCLAMAWSSVELCGANLSEHVVTFYRAVGEATMAGVRVLRCSHLSSLIQTVSVCMTRFRSAEVIPAFAACLATLPNLTTLQVIHAHSQMTTAIKNGFEGKRLLSVRKLSLPCSAHEIVKSCPNLEEVVCIDGSGSTIVGSLAKGNCHQVRILKGIRDPLTRLVKVIPNLRHIGVRRELVLQDEKRFTSFPLDTIEIEIAECGSGRPCSLTEGSRVEVKQAIKLLKESKSQAEKTVIVTGWECYPGNEFRGGFHPSGRRKISEITKV